MNTDELIRQLQLKATGANIHTANKAIYYLTIAKKRPPEDVARTTLERLAMDALASDDWFPIRQHMASWW